MLVVRDPVCGMTFTEEDSAGKTNYKEYTYYFCAPSCKKLFDADPEKYLGKAGTVGNTEARTKIDRTGGD